MCAGAGKIKVMDLRWELIFIGCAGVTPYALFHAPELMFPGYRKSLIRWSGLSEEVYQLMLRSPTTDSMFRL